MKRTFLFLLFALSAWGAWAYDFELDGIYYNIIASDVRTGYSVEVTYAGPFSYSGTDSYTGELTIPSDVTFERTPCQVVGIGESAFYMCSATKITLPSSVTSIGEKAFYRSTSLREVEMAEGLESIGYQAFYLCSALEYVALPSTVENLGFKCFGSCSALETVLSYNVTPPTCDETPFDGISSSCVLYVPAESVSTYSSTDVWKDFSSILPMTDEMTGIESVRADSTLEGIYTIGGLLVPSPTKGVNILRYSDGTSRKLLVK